MLGEDGVLMGIVTDRDVALTTRIAGGIGLGTRRSQGKTRFVELVFNHIGRKHLNFPCLYVIGPASENTREQNAGTNSPSRFTQGF